MKLLSGNVARRSALAMVAAGLCVGSSSAATWTLIGYYEPAWSPDGTQIAFTDRGDVPGDLYVMNSDGSDVRKLTNSSFQSREYSAGYPTWSADGRKIAFAYGSNGIVVINRNGSSLHMVSSGGCCADWSRSGRRIAFANGSDTSGARIYVMRPDGSGRTLVAAPRDGLHSFSMPTWSPDGQRLAFTVGAAPDSPPTATYLGVISSYRGRVTALARGSRPWEPDWSSDGHKIAYSEDLSDIRVLDLRTGSTKSLHAGQHPRWSPNGRKILFSNHGAIYVMNANGSHATRLMPR
jgi:Tol biopolymer transport system component